MLNETDEQQTGSEVSKSAVEPVVMWRADTEQWRAMPVSCPNGGYPNDDVDGCQIFTNTHFATESDAWSKLDKEIRAYVAHCGSCVERAEQDLLVRKSEAAAAAKAFAKYSEHRRKAT